MYIKQNRHSVINTILLKVLTSEKLRNSELTTNKYLIYSKMKVESKKKKKNLINSGKSHQIKLIKILIACMLSFFFLLWNFHCSVGTLTLLERCTITTPAPAQTIFDKISLQNPLKKTNIQIF